MASQLIAITSDVISATINTFGAELWSLSDKDGRELLTNADPSFWTGRAPILFPIVGSLATGHYCLGGRTYAMPKHGFARHSNFDIVKINDKKVELQLEASALTLSNYPFKFRLNIVFLLFRSSILIASTVTNVGDLPMPFSFGYHPAFAWPLPYGGAQLDHRILFEREEAPSISRLETATGLLSPQSHPSPAIGRIYQPSPEHFADDVLIWEDLVSKSLVFGVPGRTNLQIEGRGTKTLGIWQKQGASFLCIEHWAGLPDPAGFAKDIYEKPNIIILPPGCRREFKLIISLINSKDCTSF